MFAWDGTGRPCNIPEDKTVSSGSSPGNGASADGKASVHEPSPLLVGGSESGVVSIADSGKTTAASASSKAAIGGGEVIMKPGECTCIMSS